MSDPTREREGTRSARTHHQEQLRPGHLLAIARARFEGVLLACEDQDQLEGEQHIYELVGRMLMEHLRDIRMGERRQEDAD
jgi:hypothetical protein